MSKQQVLIERELQSNSKNRIWSIISDTDKLSRWIADEIQEEGKKLHFIWGDLQNSHDSRMATIAKKVKYHYIRLKWTDEEDSRTVHFESGKCEDGCDEADLGILALGIEHEAADGHQYQRYCGWQTGGELVYVADEKAEESDAPVEERWLVRDVASIVDRQYPVAMFQHGVGNHRLARFSLGIEIRES